MDSLSKIERVLTNINLIIENKDDIIKGDVDTTICYLSIKNGLWLFTNKSDTHQILPVLSFENAIALTIENGVYSHIAKTAMSLWTVRNENDQKEIIDMCEKLVLCNVIKTDS